MATGGSERRTGKRGKSHAFGLLSIRNGGGSFELARLHVLTGVAAVRVPRPGLDEDRRQHAVDDKNLRSEPPD
jgi:hypothetical protein